MRRYVFDLDGTLVDGFEDLRGALNHMVSRFGGAPLDAATFNPLVGGGARDLATRGLAASGVAGADIDEAVALFRAAYRVHCTVHTAPYEGIQDLVQALGRSRAAVLTNKPRHYAMTILRAVDLIRRVGPVVGGDSLSVRKPDPTTLRFVARLWGAPVASLVMVGDSASDMVVARAAGAMAIGVTWGHDTAEQLSAAGADAIVETPGALLLWDQQNPWKASV